MHAAAEIHPAIHGQDTDREVRRAVWSLLFLSPIIAELLTSSMPPMEFLRLPLFLVVVALYGAGALLARELTVRW